MNRFKSSVTCCIFLFVCSVYAQESDNNVTNTNIDLEQKIEKLQQQVNELIESQQKKDKQDQLNKLVEEAKKLSTVKKKETVGLGKKFQTGVRQQSGLNPNISVGGDFYAAISSSQENFTNEPSDASYGNNRFQLREVELSLNAPLDPFTRGKTHLSISDEGIEIEEAYLEWLNLPANLNLKLGLFNAEFGILNRYHDHALPQFDRPKVLVNMFGHGPVGGFGVAGNFLLPRLLFSDASSFDATVIRGGNDHSFTSEGKYNLQYIGHFKNYYDITQSTYVEWSVSGIAGKNDPAEKYWSYIGDLGFTLKWTPIDRAKYRTIEWKTEVLYGHREIPTGNIRSKGFYSSIQNQINARYWISGRIGYSELPMDEDQYEWDITACLDFWQSEFVFIRFQYQYSQRDFSNYLNIPGPYPDDHTFLVQVNWAMGPHKHEKY